LYSDDLNKGTLKFFNVNGKIENKPIKAHSSPILSIEMANALYGELKQLFATCSCDGSSIKVWSLQTISDPEVDV
jgi:WD40 repeat protein